MNKKSTYLFLNKKNIRRVLPENEITEIIEDFEYGMDIYFPVNEHRKSWKSKINEILVAAQLLSDDEKYENIIAYALDGREIILDSKTPPEEPVLVIAPCEHHGDHSVQTGNGALAKPASGSAVLKIVDFKLIDDNEPWYLGDPEIYVKLWYQNEYGNYDGPLIIGCPSINDETTYYNYNKTIMTWDYWPYYRNVSVHIKEDDNGADDLLDNRYNFTFNSSNYTNAIPIVDTEQILYIGSTHHDCELEMKLFLY